MSTRNEEQTMACEREFLNVTSDRRSLQRTRYQRDEWFVVVWSEDGPLACWCNDLSDDNSGFGLWLPTELAPGTEVLIGGFDDEGDVAVGTILWCREDHEAGGFRTGGRIKGWRPQT